MNLNNFPDQSNTQSGVSTSKAVAGTGAEFKERAAFNRRRGAMRRRVHQVSYLKIFFLDKISQNDLTYHSIFLHRLMDTNSWQLFYVSQHSAHTAKNSSGKLYSLIKII